jgi:SAM-dependent methyltransferase
MNTELPQAVRSALPRPYCDASFRLRRNGIFDDAGIDVFVDGDGGFAVLHPSPVLDYAHYVPRQEKLALGAYKKTLNVIARRLAKIADLFPEDGSILEIGAAEGGFLSQLRMLRPRLSLMAVEPDNHTKPARQQCGLVADFRTLDDAVTAGVKADIVCLFHVFEHINEPPRFLDQVRRLLTPEGRVIIEVPSLDDPLLSLYQLPTYEAFYFQRQHPFVYSGRSLSRVISANGFNVQEVRPYQRYGLENHLAWLRHSRPGGDLVFADVLASADAPYKAALEASGHTDAVFAVARPA